MTVDIDCSFCRIASRGDPDTQEVYRDEHVVALFPSDPAVLGHTMLVPRKHVADIWALDEHIASQLTRATLRVASALREAARPEGLNVIQSNGEAATQTVLHLHVHLVPRWHGDAMGPIWPEETNYTKNEKNDALTRIREACRSGRYE